MNESIMVDVLVAPRASRVRIGPIVDGRIKVAVTAAPTDGEANAAVVEALADALGVSKRDVEIVRGQTSRRKTLRIAGVTQAQIAALVQS